MYMFNAGVEGPIWQFSFIVEDKVSQLLSKESIVFFFPVIP